MMKNGWKGKNQQQILALLIHFDLLNTIYQQFNVNEEEKRKEKMKMLMMMLLMLVMILLLIIILNKKETSNDA